MQIPFLAVPGATGLSGNEEPVAEPPVRSSSNSFITRSWSSKGLHAYWRITHMTRVTNSTSGQIDFPSDPNDLFTMEQACAFLA